MTGGLTRSPFHRRWARALDRPAAYRPAAQPAPSPDVGVRPRTIAVTDVDRLKADPFAFYARKMLRLSALDPIDADPSPARSEEHTSELQSLMRISYAVFC